jgi:predicted pyridoxine 5'-phosphate oxidase superfamily flavin-nucleotide-binding protein
VREQRLAFVATVCADGTPNVSPKGTIRVWDDNHLMFGEIRSPGTIRNLAANPAIELNIVDQSLRKGYRFKGSASIVREGPEFESMMDVYRKNNDHADERIRAIVLIAVERALSLTSPAYDWGATEESLSAY